MKIELRKPGFEKITSEIERLAVEEKPHVGKYKQFRSDYSSGQEKLCVQKFVEGKTSWVASIDQPIYLRGERVLEETVVFDSNGNMDYEAYIMDGYLLEDELEAIENDQEVNTRGDELKVQLVELYRKRQKRVHEIMDILESKEAKPLDDTEISK